MPFSRPNRKVEIEKAQVGASLGVTPGKWRGEGCILFSIPNGEPTMLVLKASPSFMQRIAVVEVFGTIGGSVNSAGHERVFTAIEKDDKIRALVLDVDSPGGGVSASDYLYHSVARIAQKKPVVASIRGLGASGAYYISCAAQIIVASPAALIGSIGVLSVRPALRELLQKAGVRVSVTKSGRLKDMGAVWRDATPEETEKMQEMVDHSYDMFVSIVANARSLDEDAVRGLATGEVYWAPQARELGLVDELGDLQRAIDIAAELSGAPRKPVYMRPSRSLRAKLFGAMADSLVESVADGIERRMYNDAMRF